MLLSGLGHNGLLKEKNHQNIFFWNDLGQFQVRSVNHAFDTEELSVTLKQGVIICIQKGDKDKRHIKKSRPISLLNVSYKIVQFYTNL